MLGIGVIGSLRDKAAVNSISKEYNHRLLHIVHSTGKTQGVSVHNVSMSSRLSVYYSYKIR